VFIWGGKFRLQKEKKKKNDPDMGQMRRVAFSPSWPSLEASFNPATMLLGTGGLANAWDALRSAVMSSDAGGPAYAVVSALHYKAPIERPLLKYYRTSQ
jgi:hypothetical protein